MDPIVRLDMLLVASMCLCGAVAVMAWMAMPYLSDSSFRPRRAYLHARISLSLLVMAVALILYAFSPYVVHIGSLELHVNSLVLDSEHERLLVWFTPLLCLLALVSLTLMILALRNKFFPSRYRGDEDEYEPW